MQSMQLLATQEQEGITHGMNLNHKSTQYLIIKTMEVIIILITILNSVISDQFDTQLFNFFSLPANKKIISQCLYIFEWK